MLTVLTFIGIVTTVILNLYQIYIQRREMAKTAKNAGQCVIKDVQDIIKKI